MYSSAAVNAKPTPSTASRQCSQVSTTTSLPRSASARASAIAGNACPGSPNAATRNRPPLTYAPPLARACKIRFPPQGDLTTRLHLAHHCWRCAAATAIQRAVCASPSSACPATPRRRCCAASTSNRIIVGAYVDSESGGICPMLAAHRNGGRTDVAAFARAWDEYTRPPPAAARDPARGRHACAACSSAASTSTPRSTTSRSPSSPPRSAPSAASAPATSSPLRSIAPPEPADAPIRVRRRAPKSDLLAATERELSRSRPLARLDRVARAGRT